MIHFSTFEDDITEHAHVIDLIYWETNARPCGTDGQHKLP